MIKQAERMIVEPVEERLLCHPDYLLIHGFSLRKTFHDKATVLPCLLKVMLHLFSLFYR